MRIISLFTASLILLPGFIAMAGDEMPFDKEVWQNILPDNDQFEAAVEKLKTSAQVSSNRSELIAFVASHLRADSLDDKTQIKLGLIVRALEASSFTNDAENVRDLVTRGQSFLSFYGESLVETTPQYIELSFDVFTNQTDLLAYLFNYENQSLDSYVIQNDVLRRLKKITRKDFGKNRDAWLRWWRKKGRYWICDAETGEYGPTEIGTEP